MRRAKSRVFGTVVSILGLTACSGLVSPPAATSDISTISGSMFAVGYSRIADAYLQPSDLGEITVAGLSGLSTIDPAVGARRANGYLELLFGEAVIGAFAAPDPDDHHGWAGVTTAALERAQQVSPLLHDADPEEIYKAVYVAITAGFDPYSRYTPAKQAVEERAFRDGYGGIGLLLDTDEARRPVIQQVFDRGPASRAGVPAGAVIVAVDGMPVDEIGVDALGAKLRGPVGSLVSLTVETERTGQVTFAMQRERVIPNVVDARYQDGIAIVRVSRFNAATAQNLSTTLRTAVRTLGPEAKGIILDLRGNPGGLLPQAVEVADLFLPAGQIISTRGRNPESIQHFSAKADDLTGGLPLVVLVDNRSASGAEVVAAALQDTGRAVVVGSVSYGKGSVQTVTRLPNDGELLLTWSRIYSPAGYTLHQQGVLPAVCTSAGITDAAQVLAHFRRGEMPAPAALNAERRAAPEDAAALAQLRGTCPWQEHDAALDVAVAEMLLSDRALFAQALSATVAAPTLAAATAERLDTSN